MKKSIADQIQELQIALLQLQRSALIDTQTVMQLMIEKGICDIEDIINTRKKIETESEDIHRIDQDIQGHGGMILQTPTPESMSKKDELRKQLSELLSQLADSTGENLIL